MLGQGNIQFGPFELDLESGELRKHGRTVRLSPKPWKVLALLAAAPGRLITRESIRKELWGSDIHVDFEHALNFCIREVRTTLGDNAKEPRYIETLPRRGYRFIAPTRASAAEAPQAESALVPCDASRQLEAYQYYESARKSLGQSGKEALEKARQGFKRALEILPGYALAHSGLGATSALCSLNRRHPDDLDTAELHLMKALELDSELAEPYPWLCYVLMRKNRFEEAVEAGARAVQLQPDLVAGHYFLGLAYLVGAELDAARYQNAATHLCDAIRVDPQWQPGWFVLSDLALMVGDYRHAEYYARRLIEIGRTPKGFPFIGAELILGSVRLRQGNIPEARQFLIGFLEQLAESDHMYRDAMSAAAACVLGDVELRSGERAAALAAYRRGWHTVQEYPRIMAYQRIAERAQAGLAAAYASVGERSRAEDLVDRVSRTTQASESMAHNAAAASMSEVYWTLATALARLGNRGRALEMLKSAVRTGWRDATWMERDPEFGSLRDDPVFRRLLTDMRAWSPVHFDDRNGPRISAL